MYIRGAVQMQTWLNSAVPYCIFHYNMLLIKFTIVQLKLCLHYTEYSQNFRLRTLLISVAKLEYGLGVIFTSHKINILRISYGVYLLAMPIVIRYSVKEEERRKLRLLDWLSGRVLTAILYTSMTSSRHSSLSAGCWACRPETCSQWVWAA